MIRGGGYSACGTPPVAEGPAGGLSELQFPSSRCLSWYFLRTKYFVPTPYSYVVLRPSSFELDQQGSSLRHVATKPSSLESPFVAALVTSHFVRQLPTRETFSRNGRLVAECSHTHDAFGGWVGTAPCGCSSKSARHRNGKPKDRVHDGSRLGSIRVGGKEAWSRFSRG